MTETVKEIKFKKYNADYSKSELGTDRDQVDESKYIEVFYEFKIKDKYLRYLKNYINSIEKFYHEEFDSNGIESYRHCELHFPTPENDPHVFKIISGIIKQINNKYFKYDLFESFEVQFVKYNVGGNYGWHCDYGVSQNQNADRKLSLSIQLSEGNEYEGCDLILCNSSRIYRNLSRNIGEGVVFDSKTPHKVTHLTKGVRYCVVAWAHGPRLR